MIPVLDGLDGRPCHPHFKPYQIVCSAADHGLQDTGTQPVRASDNGFLVCSLPVDGPLNAG